MTLNVDPGPEQSERGLRLRPWMIVLVIIVAATLGRLALGWVLRPLPEKDIAVRPGADAPRWELPALSQEGTLSSDDFAGKIVVLNFWWSGCPPCREEVPVLADAHERYENRGVVVVGVDADFDPEGAARRFMTQFGMNYPVVHDDGSLAEALNISDRTFPMTFFIDRDGRFAPIRTGALTSGQGASIFGGVSEEDIDEQLRAMLAEQPQ